MRHSLVASAASFLAFLLLSLPILAGCSQSFALVRDEKHPAGGRTIVSATIHEWPQGYYSVAVTIRNVSTRPLDVDPSMFRLQGSGPTSFAPAGRMPLFLGRSGYRMPDRIEPRSSAEGEIFFGIRGTHVPIGPVRFIAALPDGEHAFDFDLIE